MATTTLRIEDTLKSRVADAAQSEGKAPHAFMLDAVNKTVDQLEFDTEFHRVADVRWAELMTTGKSTGWDQAQLYREDKARGEIARRQAARKPAR